MAAVGGGGDGGGGGCKTLLPDGMSSQRRFAAGWYSDATVPRLSKDLTDPVDKADGEPDSWAALSKPIHACTASYFSAPCPRMKIGAHASKLRATNFC